MTVAVPPRVSVVFEGFNETDGRGVAATALDALLDQDFPLDAVELVLVGSEEQCARWRRRFATPAPFGAVRFATLGGDHDGYYDVKCVGAETATAPVLAFLDSDTLAAPTWLGSIVDAIEAGAEVTAGPTLMHGRAHPAVLLANACIMSGFTLGPDGADGPRANAFSMHNLGMATATYRRHPFRRDWHHSFADVLSWSALRDEGADMRWSAGQRVSHLYEPRWWFTRFQPRLGYELAALPRGRVAEAEGRPSRSPLRVLRVTAGTVAFDLRTWPRFSAQLGLTRGRRLRFVPLVLALSVAANTARVAGAFAALVRPPRVAP